MAPFSEMKCRVFARYTRCLQKGDIYTTYKIHLPIPLLTYTRQVATKKKKKIEKTNKRTQKRKGKEKTRAESGGSHIYTVSIYLRNSQSVTASSQSLISCSLVPPKWSTNSSPNTSRATLSFAKNRSVASFRLFASRTPLSLAPPTSSPFPRGGTPISNFFSTPRQPSARMADSTR